jgi:hypothetical protein
LPQRVGLDRSYEWDQQAARLQANADTPLEAFAQIALQLVDEFGSVAAYDSIPSTRLRVFCNGDPPANPSVWRLLNDAQNDDIMCHPMI